MRENVFAFPVLERLVYGKPAAQALAAEVERIGAGRVFQFTLIATTAIHDKWLRCTPVKITSPEQVMKILEAAA